MVNKTKDFWVFVETNEDGTAKNVGIELLSPGRGLADAQGGKLVAVIIGYHTEAAVAEANKHGADQIIVVDGEEYPVRTVEAGDVTLPVRARDAHKGDFGKVYILGGSVGYTGAPVLAARAAVRTARP